jgi:hypothetical protein
MCNGKHLGSLGELLQLLILEQLHYCHLLFCAWLYYELQMPDLQPKGKRNITDNT